MKKRILIFAALCCQTFLLSILLASPLTYADADVTVPATTEVTTEPAEPDTEVPDIQNTVTLTAPKALRAGEEVTFTFSCIGTNLRALQGSLTFDQNLLTYVKSETIPDDWKITFSTEDGTLKYLGLSTENRGLDGESPLFRITFRISDDAKEGNGLPFVLSEATAYNGKEELLLSGSEFTYAVSRPLSTECTLTALSVKGGNLSPAFSPNITEYTLTLPYTAYYADIRATACEYGHLKFSKRDLSVGENKIQITVISESGLQQVYTLRITRLADPNYIPSSDNRILSIDLTDGLLFPAFSPEITEYTIYMVRGQNVTLSPTPAEKAIADSLTIEAQPTSDTTSSDATAGTFTIVCNAEDGTPRTYTFHTILLDTPEALEQERVKQEGSDESPLPSILIFSFTAVTIFFLGFVVSHLFHGGRVKKEAMPPSETKSNE